MYGEEHIAVMEDTGPSYLKVLMAVNQLEHQAPYYVVQLHALCDTNSRNKVIINTGETDLPNHDVHVARLHCHFTSCD